MMIQYKWVYGGYERWQKYECTLLFCMNSEWEISYNVAEMAKNYGESGCENGRGTEKKVRKLYFYWNCDKWENRKTNSKCWCLRLVKFVGLEGSAPATNEKMENYLQVSLKWYGIIDNTLIHLACSCECAFTRKLSIRACVPSTYICDFWMKNMNLFFVHAHGFIKPIKLKFAVWVQRCDQASTMNDKGWWSAKCYKIP